MNITMVLIIKLSDTLKGMTSASMADAFEGYGS